MMFFISGFTSFFSFSKTVFYFSFKLSKTFVSCSFFFSKLLFANVLLFLTFSPFVFLSLFITNMVPAMVGGATLALVNILIYNQTWSPFVPWICPYLIASGEIAKYTTDISMSYGIILATFIIGLAISYIYFTKKDVAL